MEKEVKKILDSHFGKYNVPSEAIQAAIISLVQLLKNPIKHKYGAFVMTQEASSAGDPQSIRDKFDEKPKSV